MLPIELLLKTINFSSLKKSLKAQCCSMERLMLYLSFKGIIRKDFHVNQFSIKYRRSAYICFQRGIVLK